MIQTIVLYLYTGNDAVLQLLLLYGADVNARQNDDSTALIIAADLVSSYSSLLIHIHIFIYSSC